MAVDVGWLDGLSPTTAKEGKPVVLFGMTCMTPRGGSIIQALRWSPDLWGDSKAGGMYAGDAASLSHSGDACESDGKSAQDSIPAHADEVLREGSNLGSDGNDLSMVTAEMQGSELSETKGNEDNQIQASEHSNTQGSAHNQTQQSEQGQTHGNEHRQTQESEHSQTQGNEHSQTQSRESGQKGRSEQSRTKGGEHSKGSESDECEDGVGQNSATPKILGIWRNAALFTKKVIKPSTEDSCEALSENDFRF